MADYTYAQLSQMQKDAAERVREMRRRAKIAADDASKQFAAPSAEAEKAEKTQKNETGPARCNGNGAGVRCCKGRSERGDLFSSLFRANGMKADESDKALLLSLCFLLQAEKADEELILSLLYLLT